MMKQFFVRRHSHRLEYKIPVLKKKKTTKQIFLESSVEPENDSSTVKKCLKFKLKAPLAREVSNCSQ